MKWNFSHVARVIAQATGSSYVFLVAVLIVLVWGLTGPLFQYSNTWQLVINTGTTIITFLMVFLIQNTQNRDTMAIQLKLDELIRAMKGARNDAINVEELTDKELGALHKQYQTLATEVREREKRDHTIDASRAKLKDAEGELKLAQEDIKSAEKQLR